MKSNKGKEKLCYQGYMYTKQIKRPKTIRWRCVNRTSFCKGTLITNADLKDPVPRNDHNHPPSSSAIATAKCIGEMKKQAAITEDKPSQIYVSE